MSEENYEECEFFITPLNKDHLCQILLKSYKKISDSVQMSQYLSFAYHMRVYCAHDTFAELSLLRTNRTLLPTFYDLIFECGFGKSSIVI